ncbi:MAG: nucleotide exchange factor GrpE [Melioribacteraceae bacterium]
MNINIFENAPYLLPPADLLSEIQRKNEVIFIERDMNLRTHADFKNYKRRIEREKNKITQEANRELIIPFLDILDDIEKAMKCVDDKKQVSITVLSLIHKKFLIFLESRGILPFISVGSKFDHNIHDAVDMIVQEGSEQGIVYDEICRGYLWNNELLRPAKVRVTGY